MRENPRRLNLGEVLAVAALSFVILLLAMPRDLFVFDEGIVLMDAMRVLNGDIIHRDFYSIYGPGQYYIVAALFHFFGKGFMVERLYDIAVRSAGIAALFFVIRARCSLFGASLFTAIGGMWMMATIDSPLYPSFPCIPLSLLGSYLVTRGGAGSVTLPSVFAAGACTGLSAVFRYDVGFLLLVAHLASIAGLIFLSEPSGGRTRHWLKAAAAYGAGAVLLFSPAAILVLTNSAIDGFLVDIVDYPTKYYSRMRGLPFPDLHAIQADLSEAAVYLPLLASGLSLLELFRLRLKWQARIDSEIHRGEQHAAAYLIVFGSTSAMLFLNGVVRVSPIHMLLGIVPALVVFAIIVSGWCHRGTKMRILAEFAVVVALLPAVSGLCHELGQSLGIKDRSIAGWLGISAGLVPVPPETPEACEAAPEPGIAKLDPAYARAANYLHAHSRSDERILVALDRHDKVFINAPALYFAAGRQPGTHWAQFDPGLQTRADVQAAIVRDLVRNSVRWVVRDGSFDQVEEPNESAQSSGVRLLDSYLDQNYRPVASSGMVSVWLRTDLIAPAPIIVSGSKECEPDPVK
jgi:hypothetical protein